MPLIDPVIDPTRAGYVERLSLDPAWSSLRGMHGGHLVGRSIAAAAAALHGREVRTVTTAFLRPGASGDAVARVATVRRGRSLSVVSVELEQGGALLATTRITATSPMSGTEWDHTAPLELPPVEQCVPIQPPPGVRHFDHLVAVLDPRHVPFSHGERARVAGHVRPRENVALDAAWLAMLLDWFPPAAFTRVDPPTGGVSVDLTVHLHRPLRGLAADEWLGAEFETKVSAGGLALEQGRVFDASGVLLAESFHTRYTG
jgi:acyl-CoA thioesterase